MSIFLTMIVMGFLLGFIGAGGSGFIIAILTAFFGIPVHTALGTSLAAMVFTSVSGTYSHYREKNLFLRVGLATGLFGAIGAFIGSHIAVFIPGDSLKNYTASVLFLAGIILALRLFTNFGKLLGQAGAENIPLGSKFWFTAGAVGLITGAMSGLFGIGASPFIQIGLLVFFGLSAQASAGTTLLIILPIAFIGGLGYYTTGNLDLPLLIKVAGGTIIGSYFGAKLTNRIHPIVLKIALVVVPISGGIMLLFG